MNLSRALSEQLMNVKSLKIKFGKFVLNVSRS